MRSIRIICVLLLLLAALAVQAQEAQPTPQTPKLVTFPQYTEVVDPVVWPYAALDNHYHLWIPQNVPVIKGLFAFVFHGCGRDFAEYAEMRALAAELHCGIVGFDKFYMYPGSENPSSVLFNALNEFATASGHPEIANAPLFTFGHSNGTRFGAGFPGKEPQRVFGWIAFKSAFGAQFSLPEIYQIPGLVISGETDESYFSDQLFTVRKLRSQNHALMHMIVEPGAGHGQNKPASYTICMAFMKTAFQLRVPADADPRLGPVKLNALQESQGWLGQTLDGTRIKPSLEAKRTWEEPIDVRRMLEIAPYAAYPGDKGLASWYPTEEYARKVQEFTMKANLPQWAEALPARGMTLEERFAQAQRLEASDPSAAMTAYGSFTGTQFAAQATARLQDAELLKRAQAREQLKRMWTAEMTLQNLPRFGKIDPKFYELNTEPLAIITDAAGIMLARYTDTADAKTARLMLERYKLPVPGALQ